MKRARSAVMAAAAATAVIAGPVVLAGAEAPATPATPAPPAYTGPLPIRVDWGSDYTLSAGFHGDAGVFELGAPALASLVLRMERGGAVVWQREGFAAITGLAAPPSPAPSDGDCEYRLALGKLAWADGTGARLGLTCITTGDRYTARELAILLELTEPREAPFPIWVGEADAYSDLDGACVRRRSVAFTLAKTTLTQAIVDEAEPGGQTCKPAWPRKKPRLATARRTVKTEVPRRPKP